MENKELNLREIILNHLGANLLVTDLKDCKPAEPDDYVNVQKNLGRTDLFYRVNGMSGHGTMVFPVQINSKRLVEDVSQLVNSYQNGREGYLVCSASNKHISYWGDCGGRGFSLVLTERTPTGYNSLEFWANLRGYNGSFDNKHSFERDLIKGDISELPDGCKIAFSDQPVEKAISKLYTFIFNKGFDQAIWSSRREHKFDTLLLPNGLGLRDIKKFFLRAFPELSDEDSLLVRMIGDGCIRPIFELPEINLNIQVKLNEYYREDFIFGEVDDGKEYLGVFTENYKKQTESFPAESLKLMGALGSPKGKQGYQYFLAPKKLVTSIIKLERKRDDALFKRFKHYMKWQGVLCPGVFYRERFER